MDKSLGQIGYEAYCEQLGWKSLVTEAPLLEWSEVAPVIKKVWEAVGEAISSSQLE